MYNFYDDLLLNRKIEILICLVETTTTENQNRIIKIVYFPPTNRFSFNLK